MASVVLILASMGLAERVARGDAMSARRLPPGIRPRGKGFTYTWRDARGQQFSRKAGDTLDEAIAYKTRIDAERLMGTYQANSKTKFADYAAQWVEVAPLKPQTRHRYRGIVHGHLIPAFGTLALPKIHPQLVRVWMAEQTAGPLSASSVRQNAAVLRSCLRAAQEDAAAGLLADLRSAGFDVTTVADLRIRGVGGKSAVPVLAAWLPKVTYRPLKFDVIGTLGSSWARPSGARPLVDEFRRIDPDTDRPGGLRWSIGSSLERVADESVLPDLLEIAVEHRYGRDRCFVVTALGNMAKARDAVIPVLVGLLDDPEVAPYAVMGLGKIRAGEARSAIAPFLDHPEAWIRKEAKRALARLT